MKEWQLIEVSDAYVQNRSNSSQDFLSFLLFCGVTPPGLDVRNLRLAIPTS